MIHYIKFNLKLQIELLDLPRNHQQTYRKIYLLLITQGEFFKTFLFIELKIIYLSTKKNFENYRENHKYLHNKETDMKKISMAI